MDKDPQNSDKQQQSAAAKQTPQKKNVIHPIRDVLGKDDNANFIKNVINVDSYDKWSYDAFPLQLVLDLGPPPKEIDYIRISSGNEQPVKIEFANDNIITGYSKGESTTLKKGINDIKLKGDVVARYIRLEFAGNKTLDEDKNQKPDPLAIYFIIPGQGEIDNSKPLPEPLDDRPDPEPPEEKEPPKPTEGRIKDNGKGWGGDYTKGAKNWKAVKMKDNQKLYKVIDENGVNIADLFHTPESANAFITWYIWKQGKDSGGKPEPPVEPPVEPPTQPPAGTVFDKNGVQLLVADGKTVEYKYKENFRDDGKRFDFNIGEGGKQSEATGYFKFTTNPVDDEVSIKWSEKSHSGSNDVQCYDTGVKIKTGAVRMRFENPHPNYSGNIGSGQGAPLGTKWVGYKGTKVVNADGTVTVEIYQDTGNNEGDKPANNWKKIYSHKDTKYKRTGAHPYVTIRVDDPAKKGQKNLEAKWLSVATI